MRTLSILLTAMVTATAWAQPVINVQNVPIIGDITTIGLCDDIVDAASLNAASGAMVTWDFSDLNETSEEQFTFVDPATTEAVLDVVGVRGGAPSTETRVRVRTASGATADDGAGRKSLAAPSMTPKSEVILCGSLVLHPYPTGSTYEK